MIINVHKDGTVIEDMEQITLTKENYPELYAVLEGIAEKENSNE